MTVCEIVTDNMNQSSTFLSTHLNITNNCIHIQFQNGGVRQLGRISRFASLQVLPPLQFEMSEFPFFPVKSELRYDSKQDNNGDIAYRQY